VSVMRGCATTDGSRDDQGTSVFRLQQRLVFVQSGADAESSWTVLQTAGGRRLLSGSESGRAVALLPVQLGVFCRRSNRRTTKIAVRRRTVGRAVGLLDRRECFDGGGSGVGLGGRRIVEVGSRLFLSGSGGESAAQVASVSVWSVRRQRVHLHHDRLTAHIRSQHVWSQNGKCPLHGREPNTPHLPAKFIQVQQVYTHSGAHASHGCHVLTSVLPVNW